MIEWDLNIRCGTGQDVRCLNTRMRQWMDRDGQERLEEYWATFGGDSCGAEVSTCSVTWRAVSRRGLT